MLLTFKIQFNWLMMTIKNSNRPFKKLTLMEFKVKISTDSENIQKLIGIGKTNFKVSQMKININVS